MKILKKCISFILVALLVVFSFQVQAAPTDSYNRVDVQGNVTETRLSREMYTATKSLTADSLGLDRKLNKITDIYASGNGDILLLCGDESRLVRIKSDYSKAEEVNIVDKSGNSVDYSGARGIYYAPDGDVYICDTLNARVLITDKNGVVKKQWGMPESDYIPDEFMYQPIAVEKDHQGFTYILSLGCYYGVLMYSPKEEFLGFYGANTLESSALDTLSFLWDKLTSNEEKQAASVKALPYSFSDFAFDSEGFMVTCTGATGESRYGKGQIRKISPNGADIMFKRDLKGNTTDSSSMNFLEKTLVNVSNPQNLVSIAVSPDNYNYVLDSTNGNIYVYDIECNLLSVFGGGIGNGEQLGIFKTANSIIFNGEELLVTDSGNCSITVFEPTRYGTLLRQAQTAYLKGNYDDARTLWQEVISLDRNCQLAYRGLAMAYYNQGDFDASMEAAEIAVDYSVYDMARSALSNQNISDNFVWILLVILLIIAAFIFVIVYFKKKNKKFVTNDKLKLMLNVPFHPFQSFEDLKYNKLGSTKIAIVLTALLYISSVLNVISAGFLYQDTLLRNYNSLFTLGGTVGLLILWSISNFLISSMFSGKGNLKEVYVASTYSLIPLIVFQFIKVILSNFVSVSMSGLISGIETVVILFVFFLLCIAMMKIHEFDLFKFILVALVTIFFMILILFVLLMIAILLKQLGAFAVSVYEEVVYR